MSGSRFNGFIDDFKIYPYARTAAEIKQDYAGGGPKGSIGNTIATDQGGDLQMGW
jgi:hypothetical protein